MRLPLLCALNFAVLAGGMRTTASDLSRPLGDPQLERPTLRSLGVSWIIQGDDNQNAIHGAVFHDAAPIVARHCHIRRVDYGLTATRNTQGTAADHFISDNLIEGPSTWPRTKGIEDARGIQVSGQGHVVCYNRIRGFADAIDTFPSRRCAAAERPGARSPT